MHSYRDQAVAEEIETIPAATGAQTLSTPEIFARPPLLSELGPQPKANQRRLPAWLVSGNDWPTLVSGAILAFLLRLFLILRVEGVISPDGVQYLVFARRLAAGNFREGFDPYWTPLYSVLVGIVSLIFRDVEFAGRFVSLLAGSLLVIPTYRLVNKWYGKKAARLSVCLIALHPLLIYYSTTVLTESTYTLLFTTGVLLGWSALTGTKGRMYMWAGATFGACYLLKPEAFGFFLLLVALTLIPGIFIAGKFHKTPVRNGLLLCAGFLLTAGPYLLYLRQVTGSWTISGKVTAHLWQGGRLAGGELKQIVVPPLPGFTAGIVQLTKALRFEYELFNLIFPTAFVLLVGLGLFRKRWTRERAYRELYLFLFLAAAALGYAVTLPNIRFLVPLLPLLICWLSQGILEFAEWIVGSLMRITGSTRALPFLRRFTTAIVVTMLVASMLPLFIYLLRGDKWGDYYGQKLAAHWIKQRTSSHLPVIMSTELITAFYAGGRQVELIDEDYESLLARAQREGVEYVVVNERDFRYMRLRELLEGHELHSGLLSVYERTEAPGHKIIVYEVAKDPKPESVISNAGNREKY